MIQVREYIYGKDIVPAGAKILSGACIDGRICIWAEVDTERVNSASTDFHLLPTGGDVQPGYRYVNTFDQHPFIWHLYQKEE